MVNYDLVSLWHPPNCQRQIILGVFNRTAVLISSKYLSGFLALSRHKKSHHTQHHEHNPSDLFIVMFKVM